MQHKSKEGQSKLLKKCSLPITGMHCVKKIVTDMAVLDVLPGGGFKLLERAPGVSVREIMDSTEGKLIMEGDIPEMRI
jgi:acyl CoA:acetate/3-ketoacid CoA transferase beta subunit